MDETVNGTVTKTYQYAPDGERLDQIAHATDGTETPSYYSYNAHTDVQAITDAGGNTKSTYGYTAYRKDDTSQDADGHRLIADDGSGCEGNVAGIEACENRYAAQQAEAAKSERYTALRDFIYTSIFNMLGSRQSATSRTN